MSISRDSELTYPVRATCRWSLTALLSGFCAVAVALVLVAGCTKASDPDAEGARQERAVPVTLQKIETHDLASTVTLVGAMDSRKSIDLFPRIDGYVAKIAVDPGQIVRKGQLIMEIDSNKQEASVAAKQSSVELAKADYAKEVGKLGSLKAEREARVSMVDFNNLEYQRYYWLEKRGVVAMATVDKEDRDLSVAKSRLASLDAEITAQKDVIERAKRRIDEAEAELRAEQAELGYHALHAPFYGVVGDVPAKVGDYVNPQTKLTTVSQAAPLEINVQVPQEQAKEIKVGTRMEILDNAGVSVGDSQVFYVSPTVNIKTQSVLVKGEFPNQDGELRPDQSVQVRFVLQSAPTLSVPTEAISFVAGKAFLFVAERQSDGKVLARQRPVAIASIQDNKATITGGLQSGDEIVVSGIQLLSDKTPIETSGGS